MDLGLLLKDYPTEDCYNRGQNSEGKEGCKGKFLSLRNCVMKNKEFIKKKKKKMPLMTVYIQDECVYTWDEMA